MKVAPFTIKPESEYYSTIDRLKTNGMDEKEISKLTGLPIDYINIALRNAGRKVPKRMSFFARDFNVSEQEIESIGNYSDVCLDLERLTRSNCGKSFTERLNNYSIFEP